MSLSCCWWPIYGIQLCEYIIWTFFNKFILTLLYHHKLDLLSGIITAATLSAFLSWLGHVTDASEELSLVYVGLLAYASGHALCGLFFYTHWIQRPVPLNRHAYHFSVMSVASYTGVTVGLYVFSFFLSFPWQTTSSSLWSLVVFPCFLVGIVAEHSGTPVIVPMPRPFNNQAQEHAMARRVETQVEVDTERVQLNGPELDVDGH